MPNAKIASVSTMIIKLVTKYEILPDANKVWDKTLMADLSRQARHPMTVVSADAAYCYDRVNHIIM